MTNQDDGAHQAQAAQPARLIYSLCRNHYIACATFSAVLNLLYLAPTIYMLQVYDRAVPTRGMATLALLTGLFALAALTIATLDWVRSRLLVRASIRLDRALAPVILQALLRRPTASGRQAAVLREFDMLKNGVTGPAALALFDAPWTPIYIAVSFLLHPALGLFALGGTGLLLGMTWLNQHATARLQTEATELATIAYGDIDASVRSADMVRALGMGQALAARHLRARETVIADQATAAFRSAGYTSAVKALRLLLQSFALGLGALLAMEQAISPGAIIAGSLLVSRALAPIELIIGAWSSVTQGRSALRSLQMLLSDDAAQGGLTRLPDPLGDIAVNHVTVVSPDRTRALLNDVSFSIERGDMLGIVGPSGAGKSTLIRALVRAETVKSGAIRLDGARLSDWPEDQLAQAIGYLPQTPMLLRGTVKENISRFRSDLGEDVDRAVIKAAKLAGAHELILDLPQGYDTAVGPLGLKMSGGQVQRLGLARALFGDPAVVVLDEPNSALDADGERTLLETLELLRLRKTTLILVAHRASVFRNANKLLVLHAGRVRHFGDRNVVMEAIGSAPAGIAAGDETDGSGERRSDSQKAA